MVNNSDTKVSYRGNGQTTVFPFSFPFIQRDYIKVAIYDSLTDETKTIDSDYYVDTVANAVIYPGYEPGQEPAEALRPPILPATSTITIYRQTDVDQLTDLGEKYPLKDIENMADKLTEIIQEQAETLERAVKVPVGDPKTPEEKLTDLQNYVKAAADSAADAADSESSAQRAAEAAATSEANAAESERLAGGYADTATAAASRAEDSAISARAYNAPDYDTAVTYQAGDVVTYTDGNSYRALQETTGNEPPNIIYWQRVTDYVGDDFFEIDEYGYIVPMDSPSHSRYWRIDQNGYIVPIEGGDGGYRPDTRSLSSEYLNVTNEGYVKHLRADDVTAQDLSATGNVTAGMVTTPQANVTTLTANAVNAGTVTANDIIAKGPIVDVRAYGAVGDGVHDDTQAIQAAIDYADANKKVVYIPSGKYKITSGIYVGNNIERIVGDSFATSVLYTSADGLIIGNESSVSGIEIDNIKILGSTANGNGITIDAKYIHFNKVHVQGLTNGIVFTGSTWSNVFTNCRFNECTDYGIKFDRDSNVYATKFYGCEMSKNDIGVYISGFQSVLFSGCILEHNNYAFDLWRGDALEIDSCYFEHDNILFYVDNSASTTYHISNCEFYGNGKDSNLGDGWVVTFNSANSNNFYAGRMQINNCTFRDYSYLPFKMINTHGYSPAYGTLAISVNNNNFFEKGSMIIYTDLFNMTGNTKYMTVDDHIAVNSDMPFYKYDNCLWFLSNIGNKRNATNSKLFRVIGSVSDSSSGVTQVQIDLPRLVGINTPRTLFNGCSVKYTDDSITQNKFYYSVDKIIVYDINSTKTVSKIIFDFSVMMNY